MAKEEEIEEGKVKERARIELAVEKTLESTPNYFVRPMDQLAGQAYRELDTASWLKQFYPPHLFSPDASSPESQRPFVTLTYAQSLDGKIAGKDGKQVILSGKESMGMTHRLRELHDSILVGVGTILSDNPQLNARIPELLPLDSQPRPFILDGSLRMPLGAKLILNAQNGIGKYPVVVGKLCEHGTELVEFQSKKDALENAGVKVYECCPVDGTQKIDFRALLDLPAPFGNSLMIEGGASVIASALASPGLVDLVIVTVAPVFVGEGINVLNLNEGDIPPQLEQLGSRLFGSDVVFVCKPK